MVKDGVFKNESRIAEAIIHRYAKSPHLVFVNTEHAKKRMKERDIISSDIMHILQYGRLAGIREETSRRGYHSYKMCRKTPNSGNREICVVVICRLRLFPFVPRLKLKTVYRDNRREPMI